MKLGLGALLLVLTCALTACGDDDPKRDLDLDKETTSAPSTQPTESESPKQATDDKPVDGKLLRGRNPAKADDEKAVADVWFAYWDELVHSYTTATLDRDRLAELATREGFDGPAGYVSKLQENKYRNVGGAIAGIQSIKMNGNKAEVLSCIRTSLIEFDSSDVAVEPLTPYIQTHEYLEKEGPDWRVTRQTVPAEGEVCEFR